MSLPLPLIKGKCHWPEALRKVFKKRILQDINIHANSGLYLHYTCLNHRVAKFATPKIKKHNLSYIFIYSYSLHELDYL